MTLEQKILELTAEDGPNIPLRTLAIYCGTTHTTLGKFSRGQQRISNNMRMQIERGIKEFAQLVNTIANTNADGDSK